jgi:hypothetical protein
VHLKNQCHLLPFSMFPPQPHPTPQPHLLPLPTISFHYVIHNFLCSPSSWTTLKMAAASSSETPVSAYRLQWQHRQVDWNLQHMHCENKESWKLVYSRQHTYTYTHEDK